MQQPRRQLEVQMSKEGHCEYGEWTSTSVGGPEWCTQPGCQWVVLS